MAAFTIWVAALVIAPLAAFIADYVIYPRLKEGKKDV